MMFQVDADFKLQDMKKAYKDLDLKQKGLKKKLDELESTIARHMEQ